MATLSCVGQMARHALMARRAFGGWDGPMALLGGLDRTSSWRSDERPTGEAGAQKKVLGVLGAEVEKHTE